MAVTAEHLNVLVTSEGTAGVAGGLHSVEGAALDAKTAIAGLGGALALASGVGFKKAIDSARNWQDTMIGVQKVTNKDTAAKLNKDLLKLGNNIPVATKELGNVAEVAGQLGVSGADNIQQFVKTTAKIGGATSLTSEEAATNFARLANATNTPISKLNEMGSASNALSNNFAANTSEITSSMLKAAPAAGSLGIKFQDLAAYSTDLVDSGMQVERAGTRLNTTFSKMATNSGDISEALGMQKSEYDKLLNQNPSALFQKILKYLGGMPSKAKRTSKAVKLFGTSGAKAVTTLVTSHDNLNKAMRISRTQYKKGTSLNKEYNAASKSFNSTLTTTKNRLFSIGVSIGNVLLPPLNKLLKAVNKGLSAFSNFNAKLNGLPGAAGLAGSGIAGLATAGAMLAVKFGLAESATGALGAAVGVLTGPIGIAAAAIVGLYVAWKENLFGIRDVVNKNLGPIRKQLNELKRNIKNAITPPLKAVKGFVQKNLPLIKKIFKGVFDTISTVLTGTTDALLKIGRILLNVVNGHFGKAFKLAKSLVTNIISGIGNWVKTTGKDLLVNSLTLLARAGVGIFNWLKDKATKVVKNFISGLVSFVKGIGKDDIYNAFHALGAGVRTVIHTFFSLGGKIGKVLKDFIGSVVSYLKNDAKGDLKTASKIMFKAVLGMGKWLKTQIIGKNGIVRTMISDIVSYLRTDAWSDIKSAAKKVVGGITAAFQGLYDGLIGHSIVPDMFTDITDYIRGWGTRVKKVISAKLRAVHDRFAQMFVNVKKRLSAWAGTLVNKVIAMGSNIHSAASHKLKALHDRFAQTFVNVKNRLVAWGDTLLNKLNSTLSDLKSAAKGWVSGFTKPFRDAKDKVLGEFSELKHKVVGNSIVPDMLDMTIGVADKWKRPFTKPFRDAKKQVLDDFEKLKRSVAGKAKDLHNSVPSISQIVSQEGAFEGKAVQRVLSNLSGGGRLHELASTYASSKYNYRGRSRQDILDGLVALSKGHESRKNANLSGNLAAGNVYEKIQSLYDQIPHMSKGGGILSDGLIMAHAGEQVVPAKANIGDGGGTTINTLVIKSDTDDPQSHARAFERALDAEVR